jgi:DNA sulfur modification protein DndD
VKFKQITFVNFMRYKGENTIRFSTDEKMNVTAVLGNNTVGKTTIAQAFRWGLYGKVISTNYVTKEKVVLLNKEVIAEMGERGTGEVSVEITVSDQTTNGEREYKFVRKQSFKRPPSNPHSHDVVPVAEAKLTVLISDDGVPQEKGVIDDQYNDIRTGYVQAMINEFFPEKLSNYFFFDGERWNDNNNKTEDIKTSVYKGYKQDKIEMRGDRAEISDFPLYLNMVAGGLDRRDQTIGGFSFVVKIYAVPVVEIIG